MAVGEIGVRNLRRHVRYYGDDDELQLSFNFHFLEQPWSAERFRAVVEEWERLLPKHSWPDYTLSNHDRSRAVSRYGLERAGVAAVMLFTLRGTPFIYYGEEIGMTDVPIPPARVVDIDGRDPERTPMQWDASPNAGFTTADPWLPLAADHARRNVAAQRDDPASVFSLYRRLNWFRKSSPALRRGSYRTIPTPSGVFAFAREVDGERVLVALNFTKSTQLVSLGTGDAQVALSTDHERDAEPLALARIELRPDEGIVLARG
jgi:alpha-glucosidase